MRSESSLMLIMIVEEKQDVVKAGIELSRADWSSAVCMHVCVHVYLCLSILSISLCGVDV